MIKILVLALLAAPLFAFSADAPVEHITALTGNHRGTPIYLKGTETLSTKATFQPPVEITIEAKTDSTDLRIAYAADQVIFNWRDMKHQLRVDGGPANGQHKTGAGIIPTNKYVLIKWVVTPWGQSIYVDGDLRFQHTGDYSKINNPVSVFSDQSKVTVKSIKVRKIIAEAK